MSANPAYPATGADVAPSSSCCDHHQQQQQRQDGCNGAAQPKGRWDSDSRSGASGAATAAGSSKGSYGSSVVGQHISVLVDRMLMAATVHASEEDGAAAGGGRAAATDPVAAAARAEFCIAWPPTFPVGGAAEVVELRAAVSLQAAAPVVKFTAAAATATAATTAGGCLPAASATSCAACLKAACGCAGGNTCSCSCGDSDSAGGVSAAAVACSRQAHLAAAAAAAVCGRVLAVREDVVVAEERVSSEAMGGGGRCSSRLRLSAEAAGVTSCVLASAEVGVWTTAGRGIVELASATGT